ncbi:hypothetical protein VB713_11875 [Anabaena cylindrica UHCC 0172]|uniref:hypothetical protein n=1 Tax=Anabaena cylindrica TaxID=1165 RepID=UPI002B202ADB|nr:hypothetical protein [Anabaena cylindrica]MEA5551668.1 hypothetical protein [Anabaena cylindrica UHCC 0172]
MATTTRTTRTRKKTPPAPVEPMPATHTEVSISEVCKAENVTEQAFRLALMDIRADDFDTIKSIPTTQSEQVLATLASAVKELPSQATTPQIAKTSTPQELQPAPETAPKTEDQHQNSDIVASSQNSQIKQASKPANGLNIPSALDELIAAAEEDINLADLVLIYRNQQISQNKEARDGELVASLRQQRTDNRDKTFDALRELNSRQPIAPDLEELPASLSDEIKALSDELGKQLNRVA